MVRVVTYNCNSIRNNAENVKAILDRSDIACFQEIMLCKSDLPILNHFSEDFQNVAFVQDRESQGIMEGRPSRGVAIFWRKALSLSISPLLIDDSIIGVILSGDNDKVLLLNVYLPCDKQTTDSLHNYRSMLAKLRVVVDEQNINNVILIGDFNASPLRGRFWSELLNFVRSSSLVVLHELLPQDTFTYLCPAKNTTSWLDHVVCSSRLVNGISNMYVDYEGSLYDHFPLYFDLEFSIEYIYHDKDISFMNFVDWHKMTEADESEVRRKIDELLNDGDLLNVDVFSCCIVNCKNEKHLKEIDHVFSSMKALLTVSTADFCFNKVKQFKIVPGWNEYIKGLYAAAREKFLVWKGSGKPTDGPELEDMRTTRTQFKYAFQKCKENEEEIRGGNMVKNLDNKKYKEFWNEVYKINKDNSDQLYCIDKERDPKSIADLFSRKYKEILDFQGNQLSNAQDFITDLSEVKKEIFHNLFSREDIHSAIKKLKPSIGFDGIHSNHLKLCSYLFQKLIADFFSCFLMHGYMSLDVLKGTINPTVKDKYGDLQSSDNYRPVMSSSVFLKLFEYCMLEKITGFISLNDRQHGFRSRYSTSTACYVLKETVLNYTRSSSNVYACFIDISKAFDSVDHNILMNKLLEYGMPSSYINIIKFWYSNQFVKVRYGTEFSAEWRICNGVRQGGVLSGLFFSIYIDSLLENVCNSQYGCKLGIIKSNVIAYADDIVLLAPSASGLQSLIDIASRESTVLKLRFNIKKSKCMVFKHSNYKLTVTKSFTIGDRPLELVDTFRYLGFVINCNLRNTEDINRSRDKFYKEFNMILRKFSFVDTRVKLFLFQQYCLQFYGCELWYNNQRSVSSLKQFAVGYHKAIKKVLGLSSHESNHFACQEAGLLTFENLINKVRIYFALRLIVEPCEFLRKTYSLLSTFSVFYKEVSEILKYKYGIESLADNDKDALMARICFVQRHEPQSRDVWD